MLLEFPVPFAPAFYELDFSEIPVLVGAFFLQKIPDFIRSVKALFSIPAYLAAASAISFPLR